MSVWLKRLFFFFFFGVGCHVDLLVCICWFCYFLDYVKVIFRIDDGCACILKCFVVDLSSCCVLVDLLAAMCSFSFFFFFFWLFFFYSMFNC